MNNKKIFFLLTAIFTLAFSYNVFSAETDTFVVGLPIDLTTGEEVTSISEGQFLAFPIDIQLKTMQKFKSYTYSGTYNPEILEPGLTEEELQTVLNNINNLGDWALIPNYNLYEEGQKGPTYGLTMITERSILQGNTPIGNPGSAVRTDMAHTLSINWYSATEIDDSRNPEFYALFKGKKNLTINDDSLNYVLLEDCIEQSSIGPQNEPHTETPKFNSCSGAFQVVIDNSKKADACIQKLYVNDPANVIEYYVQEGDLIKFPVRVNSSIAAATKDITVHAITTPDENGTGETQDIVLNSTPLTLDLSGKVSSYEHTITH